MHELLKNRNDDKKWVRSFISPFADMSIYERKEPLFTPTFSEALQHLLQIHMNPSNCSFGGYVFSERKILCEYLPGPLSDFPPSFTRDVCSTKDRYLLLYDSSAGEIKACCCDEFRRISPFKADIFSSEPFPASHPQLLPPVLFCMLAYLLEEGSIKDLFLNCLTSLRSYRDALILGEETDLHAKSVISDAGQIFGMLDEALLSSKLAYSSELMDDLSPIEKDVTSILFSERCVGSLPRMKMLAGDSMGGIGAGSTSSLKGRYAPDKGRVLSSEEEKLVPDIPESYEVPAQVISAAKAVCGSTGMFAPFRNLLFRGPAGTGKTEAAKLLAYACGLPYVFITCSSDTEVYDLLMQVIPAEGGGFRYVDSPLVEALEKGYLVEIQEPSVITKPGVLTGLNAIWDRCGQVRLMDGRVVNRHPDCIIVMTTNAGYEGCRRMNQSVISRQQLIMDFDLPPESSLIDRISLASSNRNRSMISKMIKAKKSMDRILYENGASDGDTGVRQLINWAAASQISGDPYSSAFSTIIGGATADPEIRTDLIHALDSQFEPVSSEGPDA